MCEEKAINYSVTIDDFSRLCTSMKSCAECPVGKMVTDSLIFHNCLMAIQQAPHIVSKIVSNYYGTDSLAPIREKIEIDIDI